MCGNNWKVGGSGKRENHKSAVLSLIDCLCLDQTTSKIIVCRMRNVAGGKRGDATCILKGGGQTLMLWVNWRLW